MDAVMHTHKPMIGLRGTPNPTNWIVLKILFVVWQANEQKEGQGEKKKKKILSP